MMKFAGNGIEGKKRIRATLCFFAAAFLLIALPLAVFAQDALPSLTEAEKTFIREHPTVRVGIDPAFAPFEFLDDRGNYVGIAPDYLNLIAEKTGLVFVPAKDVSYTEAQEMVLSHEMDLLPTLGWTAERAEKFLLSQRYYEYKLAFVVQAGSRFKSVGDFRGQIIAAQGSTSNADFALTYLNSGLSLYESEEDAVLAVADGRETAMLGYLPSVLYSARNLGLSNLNYLTFESDSNNGWHMGVRNDRPELLSILNKALAEITPSEKAEIQNRWIRIDTGEDTLFFLRAMSVAAAVLLAMSAFITIKTYNHKKKLALHLQNEALLQEMVRERTEDLQKQTQLAMEASQAKSAFLARMSHEIRTPMNVIIGLSEVALGRDLSEDVREDVWNIRQAGVSLLSIINDILDISKIEAGKTEIVNAEYTLNSLLRDTENIIKFKIAEKPLAFTVNVDPGLPNKLLGDAVRIRQILLNILGNAVKYTHKGSVTLTVSGTVRKEGEILLFFETADTGIGIRQEDIPKLFGNFSQIDIQRNQGIEGTGLGLAISQSLCRMMGGEIAVRSVYGEGSVFTVLIPQRIEDDSPVGLYAKERETVRRHDGGKRSVKFTAPTARVLAVDDSKTNLAVLKGLLSPFRVTVDSCLSGEEAVESVKRNPYDLIFMDHMMPGMDGVEAVKAIRAWESELGDGVSVSVIALTANAVSGMREMFLENGFNDFLSKPIETAKLDDILEEWIPPAKQEKTEPKDS
jgi:signal transduction histidine kinase/ActR/RegA family two-component response regulator